MTLGIRLATHYSRDVELVGGFRFFRKTSQVLLLGPLTLGTSVGLMLRISGLCTIRCVEIPNLHFRIFSL